jgi:ATP-dependent RNA helicase DeaD
VAARGIDLPDLGLVVHADLPQRRDTLLHRSGRTGRAGRKGTSVLLVPHTRRRVAERLLASARIDAAWAAPPSADEIRAQDQTRLLQDAAWAEEPADEDRAAARALLAERTAEDIAAALVRLHRTRLPAPEELLDSGAERATGGPNGRRLAPEDTVWFQMNIGRNRNADPGWLVPLICRRGHVTKREIGAIRIFERETKFEIAREAAGRFASAVRRSDAKDGEIRIEPTRAGPRGAARDRSHRRAAGNRYARPGHS